MSVRCCQMEKCFYIIHIYSNIYIGSERFVKLPRRSKISCSKGILIVRYGGLILTVQLWGIWCWYWYSSQSTFLNEYWFFPGSKNRITFNWIICKNTFGKILDKILVHFIYSIFVRAFCACNKFNQRLFLLRLNAPHKYKILFDCGSAYSWLRCGGKNTIFIMIFFFFGDSGCGVRRHVVARCVVNKLKMRGW